MRRRPIAVLAAVAATGAGGVALAGSMSRQSAEIRFTTARPAASTGIRTEISYRNPEDPDGKPRPVRMVVTDYPRGSRFDDRVAPICEATDAQLMAQGREACPPASRLGGGDVTAVTGLGEPTDPIEGDLTVFNMSRGIILLATREGTGEALGVNRGTFRGSRLTIPVPPTPGVPDQFQPAITEVALVTHPRSARRGRGRINGFTTPRTCPRSRRWTIRVRFTYDDGVRQTSTATTPCRPARRRRR